jgi:hypothetical protein
MGNPPSSNNPLPQQLLDLVKKQFGELVIPLAQAEVIRQQKNYQLQFYILPDGKLQIHGDGEVWLSPEFLEQCDSLLKRLISNAI